MVVLILRYQSHQMEMVPPCKHDLYMLRYTPKFLLISSVTILHQCYLCHCREWMLCNTAQPVLQFLLGHNLRYLSLLIHFLVSMVVPSYWAMWNVPVEAVSYVELSAIISIFLPTTSQNCKELFLFRFNLLRIIICWYTVMWTNHAMTASKSGTTAAWSGTDCDE